MKIAIEAYVSIFIMCLCILLCVCVISADLDAASARDAYTTYVLQLQDSNYAESVIEACERDASNKGYTLTVEPYVNGNGERTATIDFCYDYTIPVIQYTTQRYIKRYSS